MEYNRAALHKSSPPFIVSFCRYVLSFTCASGNPCIFSLSTDGGHLEEFQGGGKLNYCFRNHTYTGSVFDYYKNRSYIKFINGFTCLVQKTQVIVRNVRTNVEFHLPLLNQEPDRSSVFFCYDSAAATDPYKVLTAITNLKNIHLNMRFSIFTLGVDNAWRDIPQKGLHHLGYAYSESSSACVKGVLFCTGFSTSGDYEDGVIAAFDIGRERFDIVAYPDGLSTSRYSWCSLINVKGSLAIVDVEQDDYLGSWRIRLWIRVEGLGAEPWMEHRIRFPSPLENTSITCCQFCFTTNRYGEMVIAVAKISSPWGWVFSHNIDTGRWRRIGMFLISGHVIYSHFFIDEYVGTPS